ncbi:MAG: iron-sulfur cluster assembly accessory protein [Flavobacteriales bacterium]|jgi:iron-sulfur cluster assembly accessory protein
MTVETFNIEQNFSLKVSASAAEHFLGRLEKTHKAMIRVSMKESGCTGFRYIIEEVDTVESSDMCQVLDNGVKMAIDPKYLGELQGTEIDFRKEGLNRNLVLENPNVKNACGCGESIGF